MNKFMYRILGIVFGIVSLPINLVFAVLTSIIAETQRMVVFCTTNIFRSMVYLMRQGTMGFMVLIGESKIKEYEERVLEFDEALDKLWCYKGKQKDLDEIKQIRETAKKIREDREVKKQAEQILRDAGYEEANLK